MFRCTDETRYVAASQWTGASLQIIEQDLERLWIELDDVELYEREKFIIYKMLFYIKSVGNNLK